MVVIWCILKYSVLSQFGGTKWKCMVCVSLERILCILKIEKSETMWWRLSGSLWLDTVSCECFSKQIQVYPEEKGFCYHNSATELRISGSVWPFKWKRQCLLIIQQIGVWEMRLECGSENSWKSRGKVHTCNHGAGGWNKANPGNSLASQPGRQAFPQ